MLDESLSMKGTPWNNLMEAFKKFLNDLAEN